MNISCALVPLKKRLLQGFPPTYVACFSFSSNLLNSPGHPPPSPFPPLFPRPNGSHSLRSEARPCSSERSGIVGPVTPSLPERAYTLVSLPRELNIKWVEGGGERVCSFPPLFPSCIHPSCWHSGISPSGKTSQGEEDEEDVARALIPENRRFSNATVLPFLETFPQRPIRE